MFTSFFKKPKDSSAKATTSANAGPSTTPTKKTEGVSDFVATFLPFTVKKDATLAPVNLFLTEEYKRKCRPYKDVIELNSDGAVVIKLEDDDEEHQNDPQPSNPSGAKISCGPETYNTDMRRQMS